MVQVGDLVASAGDGGGRRRRNAFIQVASPLLPPAARLPRLETASLTLGAATAPPFQSISSR